MQGTGVIDRFLEVFTSYIDSGFGLLGGEVAFLSSTLVAIDLVLRDCSGALHQTRTSSRGWSAKRSISGSSRS